MAEKKGGKKGEMTVEEAGRRGGEATARTHGREFYEQIGHKGGKQTARSHSREFYEEIGHKGGEKGGQRVRKLIEEGKGAKERK